MANQKQQWLRRRLKKRYLWLRIECFTPLSVRSPCCNATVWRAKRGRPTRYFCDKCTGRLTPELKLNPYGYSIKEVHEMMMDGPYKEFKAAIEKHGNTIEALRPAIRIFLFEFYRIVSLLN